MTRWAHLVALALVTATIALCASPPPAGALSLNPIGKVCSVAGFLSKLAGKACNVLQGGRLATAGEKLLSGSPGAAAKALLSGGATRAAGFGLGLAAVGAWVLGGARAALRETEKEIGKTTSPRLQTTWFSSTYWRVAGLAALLTLPFLFAAALQALIRSDLTLLARAAFGYLPLALLAVSIAAPLTMLVLAASDEMCAIVSSASGGAGVGFLRAFGGVAGGLSVIDGSPFLAFFIGALLAGAALAVSLELLVREAAVYVVVLMLPLAFAGMVWPARRIWAVRALETLVALILAKFAIVAVLALAGGALGSWGASGMFAGTALVMLAAFSPFVLFRLLPFAELAGAASGALRGEGARLDRHVLGADALGGAIEGWATSVTAGMSSDAERSTVAASGGAAEASRLEPAGRSDQAAGSRAVLASGGADAPGGGPGVGPGGGSGNGTGGRPAGAEAALNGLAGAGADPAESGLTGSASTAGAEDSPAPRLPGMDPHWQTGDGEWGTLEFGPGSRPSAPLQPRGPDDAPADEPPATADSQEPGPLPPSQDPQGGRL
ncbi:MAG: hypothetical protein M3Z06_08005 [Actinomycetota bacterium]|nr:hypothetical protein [Actinomycetota bacterium]